MDPVAADALRAAAAPQGFERLVPLAAARAAVLAAGSTLTVVRRPLARAVGLRCAETLRAGTVAPRATTASRDGYAVDSRDTVGAAPHAPVYVGAPLPVAWAGAELQAPHDAILPPDAMMAGPGGAEILQALAPATGARVAGHDLGYGAVLAREGDRLRPDRVALLALAGVDEVSVRVPRLAVVGRGAAADLVSSLAAREGCEIVGPDAADATVVLAPPGRGGTAEALRSVAAAGVLVAHGLAVRPGEAIGLRTAVRSDGRTDLVFVVPDRLEEVMAAWLLLVGPSMAARAGWTEALEGTTLPLTRKIVSSPGMAEMVLLRRVAAAWEPLAVGDLPWSAFAAADAFALIPAESEGIAAGGLLAGMAL